jgi:hypothetical protein
MIWEGIYREEEEAHIDVLRIFPLIALSLATSIDALAVGVSFGILQTAVLVPALIIGIVCGAISFAGVMLGEQLEALLGNRMEIAGRSDPYPDRCESLNGTRVLLSNCPGFSLRPAVPMPVAESGKKEWMQNASIIARSFNYQTSGKAMLV